MNYITIHLCADGRKFHHHPADYRMCINCGRHIATHKTGRREIADERHPAFPSMEAIADTTVAPPPRKLP